MSDIPQELEPSPLAQNSHGQERIELHHGLNADVIAARKERTTPQTFAPKTKQPWLHAYEPFLIPALILFLVGASLAYGFPNLALLKPSIAGTLAFILVGIVISCFRQPFKRKHVQFSLWLLSLLTGMQFYTISQHHAPSQLAQLVSLENPRRIAKVSGILTTSPNTRKVLMTVISVDDKPLSGKIQIDLPFSIPDSLRAQLVAGRHVKTIGTLQRPFESSIPGTFDQVAYLRSLGVSAVLSHTGHWLLGDVSDAFPYPLLRTADSLKTQVWQSFKAALPSPQAEVFAGLVLGDKAVPVDKQTKQAFIDTGLIHLLAASGMNVGIVAGSIFCLMGALRLPLRLQIVIAMGSVAFYSLLTGLPPSIQRATMMLEIALLFKFFDRQLSNVFLLCLVTCILVVLQPELIGSIGFQFSVLSTFGLLAMIPRAQEWLGYYITRWLASLILVPFIAQLWILPLSVSYFNRFPLHSVPLNILAIVLITPLTVLGFVAALLSLVFPQAVSICGMVAKPFLDGLLKLTSTGESQAWAQWSLPSPSPWQLLACYGLLFLALLWVTRLQTRRWGSPRAWLLALSPVLLILFGLALEKSDFQAQAYLTRLPLAENQDAFLFKPEQSQDWILLSPGHLRSYAGRALRDYLKHQQIRHLKAMVILSNNDSSEIPPKRGNSLKKSLKDTQIDWLIAPAEMASSSAFSIPAGQSRIIPDQSTLKITLGNASLLASNEGMRLQSAAYCLLGTGKSASTDCGWQKLHAEETTFISARLSGKTLSVEQLRAKP